MPVNLQKLDKKVWNQRECIDKWHPDQVTSKYVEVNLNFHFAIRLKKKLNKFIYMELYLNYVINFFSMFCAGGEIGLDSCKGDSGY